MVLRCLNHQIDTFIPGNKEAFNIIYFSDRPEDSSWYRRKPGVFCVCVCATFIPYIETGVGPGSSFDITTTHGLDCPGIKYR